MTTRLFLLGLPGSGKTAVGRAVAEMLGWRFMDTDDIIEERTGVSIERLFAEAGEDGFRGAEAEALLDAARAGRVVIATGGGVVVRSGNRALMRDAGWRVTLAVSPDVALARLGATTPGDPPGARPRTRPLLVGDNPLARLEAIRAARQAFYAEADATVPTDGLAVMEVAGRVVAELVVRGELPGPADARVTRVRGGPDNGYDAVVEWGGMARIGERLAGLGLPPRTHIVADARVAALYGAGVIANLAAAGFEAAMFVVAAGEVSKSRDSLAAIEDWLITCRAERREAVVALGGGMVGDLAGFAAATYLRGVPFIQVPTTLLAQVDASIGGKVGINHPLGKNLLGAFHPPRMVLADPAVLVTLARRMRIEGWAEVVKHGVALDARYFTDLERDVEHLRAFSPDHVTAAIAGSVRIKGGVVGDDERERDDGRRLLLNYGHTIGHALEATEGYGTWAHGEAVAIGMAAAARIGQALGVTPPDVVARQDALLEALGLPMRCPDVPARALMRAALWDKKVRGGRVRWVLISRLGEARVVENVPDDVVRSALLEIGASGDAGE